MDRNESNSFYSNEMVLVPIVTEDHLKELSKFNNFCIHPYFHGLSELGCENITGFHPYLFDSLFNAFQKISGCSELTFIQHLVQMFVIPMISKNFSTVLKLLMKTSR